MMKIKILVIQSWIWMSLLACQDQNRNVQEKNIQASDSIPVNKPGTESMDSLMIPGNSAVFFEPDSIQLEKIRSVVEPGVFEATTHEYFYQQRNARIFLTRDWPSIKIINTKSHRFLVFERPGGKNETIDLNRLSDSHGMFVFDGKNQPRLLDMMNVETQVADYFNMPGQ